MWKKRLKGYSLPERHQKAKPVSSREKINEYFVFSGTLPFMKALGVPLADNFFLLIVF